LRIHLVVNTHRADAVEAARKTVDWLNSHKVDVGVEADAKTFVDTRIVPESEICNADLVITFGGDGTVMRAAHLCSERGTPILGVHFGRFGFVTQAKGEELDTILASVLKEAPKTEERMMLRTELMRNGQSVATMHALNEVALQRAITARMMTFEVIIDGHPITSYPADGVLVATPTGSTGYNLSAGGPIVDPKVKAIILTAISAHTLGARPLLLRPESEVRLKLKTEGDAVLSADGQTRLHLLTGDEVLITRSERITKLVTVESNDFLAKLRDRLFWGRTGDRCDD
jgi:NAD+ kinase